MTLHKASTSPCHRKMQIKQFSDNIFAANLIKAFPFALSPYISVYAHYFITIDATSLIFGHYFSLNSA